MKFHSKSGQDQFLLERFFRGKRGGVFVDIGAADGESFSNTLFFERSMGWRGLCIEAAPSSFAKLAARRKAWCENISLAPSPGEAATKLASLLSKHSLFDIDYCSIAAKGEELAILGELDFARFRIAVLTVASDSDGDRLPAFMAAKGYDVAAKLEGEFVFKRRDVTPLPRTTVICAVWHRDPKRHARLRGHVENLARQSVPVDVVYVFDGGDVPPSWLRARAIAVKETLSIYQAWNVALALVETPLAMNLNLDDRLAPDAVEFLERELLGSRAIAAGADWNICYSQEDTDRVEPSYPASRLPFVPDWPPRAGTRTRLGSGTGERGTLGPATMWRMEAHLGAPRFPWRLSDGSLLRVSGDLAWWRILQSNPNYKLAALPMIIGNYYSHPEDQAEFRAGDERALMADPGVSLL